MPAPVGPGRGRCRRRHRRPGGGVGAVPGPGRRRGDRRARRGAAGGAGADVARPRCRWSSGRGGPACRCCCDVAVPNGHGRGRGRRCASLRLPVGDERAGWPIVDVIDRTRRGAVADVAAVVRRSSVTFADPTPTVVCVHNTPGPRPGAGLPHLPGAAALRAVRRRGQSGRRRRRCNVARCGAERPPVCLECGGRRSPTCAPGSPGCARSSRPRPAARWSR